MDWKKGNRMVGDSQEQIDDLQPHAMFRKMTCLRDLTVSRASIGFR